MDTPSGDVKVGPSSLRKVDFGSVRELFSRRADKNPGDGFLVVVDLDLVSFRPLTGNIEVLFGKITVEDACIEMFPSPYGEYRCLIL